MKDTVVEKNKKTIGFVGNSSLVSVNEAAMVSMLRKRNYEHANQMCEPVHVRSTFYTKVVKRGIDIIVSLIACIVLLPFNAVFAVFTFFDVGSPILYKQARCGKNGKSFIMVKFRNMNNNMDENGKLLPAAQRITKFGHFMRRYSLDELLNFWNILKGDMSLIGPRPLPMFFHERMNDRHKMRTAVTPGLECPRVFVPEGKDLCLYHKQFENDIWYVENISFKTDVKMVIHLVKMAFNMGVRDITAGGGTYFVGYDENGHALDFTSAMALFSEDPVFKAEVSNIMAEQGKTTAVSV